MTYLAYLISHKIDTPPVIVVGLGLVCDVLILVWMVAR